jgi:hypothetical protein
MVAGRSWPWPSYSHASGPWGVRPVDPNLQCLDYVDPVLCLKPREGLRTILSCQRRVTAGRVTNGTSALPR